MAGSPSHEHASASRGGFNCSLLAELSECTKVPNTKDDWVTAGIRGKASRCRISYGRGRSAVHLLDSGVGTFLLATPVTRISPMPPSAGPQAQVFTLWPLQLLQWLDARPNPHCQTRHRVARCSRAEAEQYIEGGRVCVESDVEEDPQW